MTDEQAREVFNEAIRQIQDPDQKADAEIAREYFTNPAFRAWLESRTFEINQGRTTKGQTE